MLCIVGVMRDPGDCIKPIVRPDSVSCFKWGCVPPAVGPGGGSTVGVYNSGIRTRTLMLVWELQALRSFKEKKKKENDEKVN